MPRTALPLHDVVNVEAFVRDTIRRSRIVIFGDDYDDLVAEGLCIMVVLAEQFEPHRPGYARPGSFSGFAAQFLPRRLGDAWHRMHPEHRYITDPGTGKREWVYLEPPVSLEAFVGSRPGSLHSGTFDDPGDRRDSVDHTGRRVGDFVPIPARAAA